MIQLDDLLKKEHIISNLQAFTKNEALGEMLDKLRETCPNLDRDSALSKFLEREALGSTGIGDEVAIPHCWMDGCGKPMVVLARSVTGCDFAALDGRKCHIFCLLLMPENMPGHFNILAHFARMLKLKEFRSRFMESADAEEILNLLKFFWRG